MTAAASTELPKTYDPSTVEAEAYRVWLDEKCFAADPGAPGEPYCIVIPPPNVTGALHLGHAINNTLQDILTRVHRMRGFNTLWIPGIDHAGIATQAVVEKQLKEKENKTRHDVGREGLVERIWAWKQQYGDRILSQLQRLGCSCDWDRTRFTLDDMCAKAVRETFFKLFKDGLIYRGKRLVNWDTHLLTSISDDELYTETVKTSMWHIKYPIDGTDQSMTVATTRPETMLADTAVAVHPDDPRWNWAIGKSVRLPLTNRLIPIIGDPILVDMAFGSGVVKVTPAHDPNDYAVYTRHKGTPTEIAIINLMTPDGKVNDADPSWSAYTGLTFAAARKKVVEDLIAGGFMTEADIKPHEANVSFSDRSKTAIQPYLSDQWFVKMAPLAEPALEVVRNGTIKFYPERHAQQYLSWLGEKRDWPISRQLWWGHRIPIWSKEFATRAEADAFAEELSRSFECESNAAQVYESDGRYFVFVCIGDDTFGSATDGKISTILETRDGFTQDPDVLDTWFSSALWPHSTLGWPEATAELKKWYPTNVLMTGRDIITLWVARMVMMGMYNLGRNEERGTMNDEQKKSNDERRTLNDEQKSSSGRSSFIVPRSSFSSGIPFHHVAINPTILDGKGERMSKSKGNGVDPVDIIDTHGADGLRFTLTTMATETQDVRLPVKKLPDGRNTSDKFDLGRNFCSKLWNAARFALSNLEGIPHRSRAGTPISAPAGNPAALPRDFVRESSNESPTSIEPKSAFSPASLPDRWILSRLAHTLDVADDALGIYRFDVYAKACYDFFWRDFCDWYVEATKLVFKPASSSATTSAASFSSLVPPSSGDDENKTSGLKSAALSASSSTETADVLAAVLDASLRLMHPIIPFITETIWWKLNAVRQERDIPGLPAGHNQRLIRAAWPVADTVLKDAEADATFAKLQELVQAIRNIRNEYKVPERKPVTVSLVGPAEFTKQVEENRTIVEQLATCVVQIALAGQAPPANAARASAAGCDIFIEGVIDPDAEKQRIAKRLEEVNKQIAGRLGRLSNEAYISKAPVVLVEQTKKELAELETEKRKLET